jgi:SAM-dependent methyltransferase
MLPDYSEYLTPERLAHEDNVWADVKYYNVYADLIGSAILIGSATPYIRSVVEFGCGTGYVATCLPKTVEYLGIDANRGCVLRAIDRNAMRPQITFVHADIRTAQVEDVDVSCAFAVLKHFGLHEWDNIVKCVLRPGRNSVFTIPPATDTDYDDGVDYPHVHVTEARIRAAVNAAGHTVRRIDPLPFDELAVFTSRVERVQ